MNIFSLHGNIIKDYSYYIRSFLNIKDEEIRKVVDEDLDKGTLWPEPLIQFNPTFKIGKTILEMNKNHYQEFLELRRKLMSEKIKAYYSSL